MSDLLIEAIYCVQVFKNDVWRTAFASTYHPDAEEAYEEVVWGLELPVRLVRFRVRGVDFIATHARDYELLDSRG